MTAKVNIPEGVVKRQVCQVLEFHGYVVYRINNAGTFNKKSGGFFFHGTPGFPDVVAIHPKEHIILFVETKSSKGNASPAQTAFKSLVAGCYFWKVDASIVHSVDEIQAVINTALMP
jgi:hypothetical protein